MADTPLGELRNRVKELRYIRAGDLFAHPLNPRSHPARQRSALDASLDAIGIAGVLLAYPADGGLRLFDGHLRKLRDPEEVWPVVITDLSQEEARLAMQIMDPLAALAELDRDRLSQLRALSLQDRLDGLIAPGPDLDLLLGRKSTGGLLEGTDADAVPTGVEARCELGDLWELGDRRHRLLCGDATDAGDVRRLMGSERPVLCVTDPPYGVEYEPGWRNEAAEKGHLSYADRRVGEVPNDDRCDLSEAWRLCPSDVIYSWHPPGATSLVHAHALQDSGFEIRVQIIWSKPHFVIGRGHYHARHEPCWYAVKKGSKSHWIGDHTQTTVWEIALDRNVEGGHSTQKPVECMARAIRNHEGDIYDPFVGSGTSVIAAEQNERRCFAMEIHPPYADICLARFEQATGQSVRLIDRLSSGSA